MPQRADAHIHLFERSLGGTLPGRSGVQIDEAACYDALATDNDVAAALIVCFAAAEGNERNNEFVAGLKPRYDWIQPAAYADPQAPPAIATLEQWRDSGFVGLVMYIGAENAAAVKAVPDEIWDWVIANQWVLSVNSSGETWSAFHDVLDRHGELRLLMSHLGLPARVVEPIDRSQAREALTHQTAMARYPRVHVKLSGFYAMTEPGYDYPHELAWPYVEVLRESFGVERLLWASDYSPCLNFHTVAQTVGMFWKMPFLSDDDRDRIAGGNLLALLKDAADN